MKNLPEVLRQFNWIDIFAVILALRILYSSFKQGLKFEFFKVLGTLCALYVSLHYFSSLSAFFNIRVFNRHTQSTLFDTLSFLLLVFASYGFFALLRFLTGKVMQSEVNSRIDKWGGLALGAVRAVLTVSIALCVFLVTSGAYFKKSIRSSFSGPYFSRVAPDTYAYFWNTVGSKLQKKGTLNPAAADLTKTY